MKKTDSIEVNAELSNYVEAAAYEVNSRVDVISFMLSNNMSTSTDSFRSYQAELIEYKKKYELAKAEVEKQIVKPYLDAHQIPNATWNLDFATRVITLEWDDYNNDPSKAFCAPAGNTCNGCTPV